MPPEPTVWDNLRRKLPYYLIGLAIGFVLLGFIRMGHNKARQADKASRETIEPPIQSPNQSPTNASPAPAP